MAHGSGLDAFLGIGAETTYGTRVAPTTFLPFNEESLALSKEYFCRLFKKYTGQTFLEYLNDVRTMHLYEDLQNSDETITVLMEKNGLSNYKIFMRTFKKLYGSTPQKMRSNRIRHV